MSSQDDSGISFSISNDQQNFRLLELPPSLLELIASEHPPVLYLKSEQPNSGAASAPTPTAVICTHDHTFEVRQVQSSNILYILQPSSNGLDNGIDSSSLSGVTAIGQCKALLELVPVQTQSVHFLRNAIPIYNEKKFLPDIHQQTSETRSKQVLLTNAPFSTAEFEAAWTELCAFEIEDEAWRPSASQLEQIWASFMTATTIRGIDVTNTFQYVDRILTVEEDCWDEAMPQAILRRLSSDHENTMEGWVLIDRVKCVQWVGRVYLEVLCHGSKRAPPNFLQLWKDHLPERWREDAKLDLLQAFFTDLGHGSITFKDHSLTATNAGVRAPAVSTTSKNKSKWHDRFKRTRT
ncbi:hypothetical protein MMC26_002246 [Xylographa opegraphella]|nr:hypothetical protein [Xylographa opegraphella]